MKLSNNFTLDELIVTDTGLPNVPDELQMTKLLYLCQYVLQPIRDKWGLIIVTSGYRSMEVNQAIGGAESSQHRLGEAADIVRKDLDPAHLEGLFQWCINNLRFGQCIRESKDGKDWLHISLPRINKVNQEVLVYENGIYRRVI